MVSLTMEIHRNNFGIFFVAIFVLTVPGLLLWTWRFSLCFCYTVFLQCYLLDAFNCNMHPDFKIWNVKKMHLRIGEVQYFMILLYIPVSIIQIPTVFLLKEGLHAGDKPCIWLLIVFLSVVLYFIIMWVIVWLSQHNSQPHLFRNLGHVPIRNECVQTSVALFQLFQKVLSFKMSQVAQSL
jgi:hypothetical protein